MTVKRRAGEKRGMGRAGEWAELEKGQSCLMPSGLENIHLLKRVFILCNTAKEQAWFFPTDN